MLPGQCINSAKYHRLPTYINHNIAPRSTQVGTSRASKNPRTPGRHSNPQSSFQTVLIYTQLSAQDREVGESAANFIIIVQSTVYKHLFSELTACPKDFAYHTSDQLLYYPHPRKQQAHKTTHTNRRRHTRAIRDGRGEPNKQCTQRD